MGTIILRALKESGLYNIRAVEKDEARRREIDQKYDVQASACLEKSESSDVYILAVKPGDVAGVARRLAEKSGSSAKDILIISLAAGIKAEEIKGFFNKEAVSVIRVMPNTPALVAQGMSALQSDTGASKENIELAENIFSLMGEVVLIEGDKFDAVTALSGSGPAYFFYIAEIMSAYAQSAGFSEKQADIIAFQTMLGAATLMKKEHEKDGKSFTRLKKEVTSPGGTTEAAVKSMEKNNLGGIFKKALDAALSRSKEISEGDK